MATSSTLRIERKRQKKSVAERLVAKAFPTSEERPETASGKGRQGKD